jgi:hypothetical protein
VTLFTDQFIEKVGYMDFLQNYQKKGSNGSKTMKMGVKKICNDKDM